MDMKQLFALVLVLWSFTAHSQTVETVISVPISPSGTEQALLYEPSTYATTSQLPLLIFLHGAGESCPPLSNIYGSSSAGGPAYYIEQKQWPSSFINPITGAKEQLIVLSPQANCNNWSTSGVSLIQIINFMVANYHVDPARIYLTGLSAGGDGLFDYVTGESDNNVPTPKPQYEPAAIVPMSMASNRPNDADVAATIAANIHVWGFGSETDIYGEYTHLFITGTYQGNNGPTPPALGSLGRFTAYSGGHCCWGQFYDPAYTEVINGVTMNIYQWMLQYSRVSTNLPILFSDFSLSQYKNDSTLIIWGTDMESGSSKFIIERSTDGKTFTPVGSVPTKAPGGNSSQPIQYQFIYKKP